MGFFRSIPHRKQNKRSTPEFKFAGRGSFFGIMTGRGKLHIPDEAAGAGDSTACQFGFAGNSRGMKKPFST
jgi:hypothetical protein